MLERLRITFSTGHQCLLYDRNDGLSPVNFGLLVGDKIEGKQLTFERLPDPVPQP